MREIKFRAWDKLRKEWYDENDPDILTFYGFAIFGECALICTPPVGYLQNLEITQYTGAKGAVSKEPCLHQEWYEGDIVTIPAHYEGDKWIDEYTGEIIFEDCGFYISGHNHSNSIFDAVNNYRAYRVGNIYENPELCTKP